jgi:hypothetical protein
MKISAVALACAALSAGTAGCNSQPPGYSSPAQSRSASALPKPALPPGAAQGRTLLSQAQVAEALRSGTIDRPVRSLLAVKAPLQFGEFAWNDKGVPPGPTWIRVDLGRQIISVFRGPDEVGTAVLVYGGENKETPVGKFHVLMRDRDHRSSIYDAAMPFTLQLTSDGVSIHGSSVRWGAATHGCIGVPLDFAHRLFDQARVGDEVVIVPPPSGKPATT